MPLAILGLSWLAFSPPPLDAQGWDFSPQDIGDTLSADCDDINAADLDGDGDADILLTEDPYISWFENGGGALPTWTRHTIASDGGYMGTIVGDFDGDGDWDVASGNKTGAMHTYWFENDGTGTGWTPHQLPVSGDNVDNMRAHDYNGDGRDDLIIEQYGASDPLFYCPSPADPTGPWPSYQIGVGTGVSLGDVDKDGDMDVVTSGKVLLCPADPAQPNWPVMAPDPPPGDSYDKSGVGDIDGDGNPDIVFSEGEGPNVVVAFGPDWSRTTTVFLGNSGMHTLQLADFDSDGDLDIFSAEIHGNGRTFVFENADGLGTAWTPHMMSGGDPAGTHNGWIADVNGDGRIDLLSKHYTGGQITIWYNTLQWALDNWQYIHVSGSHTQTFGLSFGFVDDDQSMDIISGPYWYANPGGDMTGSWTQSAAFPSGLHGVLAADVDGDDQADVIGINGTDITWLEATDASATSWSEVSIGSVPAASHSLGAQGYRVADIEAGGRPEIVVSSGDGIYYFRIPADPAAGAWPRVHVSSNPTDEGFGVGDIDGDGDLDLAAGLGSPDNVEWYRNPGDGSPEWPAFSVGDMGGAVWTDRVAIADLNGDGRPDIIATEENGATSGAEAYWWEQPLDPTSGGWPRHLITSRASLNSMDVADMDHDGDIDVILAEHVGPLRVSVFENDGQGQWTEHVVDSGKESHLGGRVADLDGDGDLDIVSIAYNAPQDVHLWRNDGQGGVPVDTQPPSIASVLAVGDSQVRVVFDEPVDPVTASAVVHYSIDHGAAVLGSAIQTATTVLLSTSALVEGVTYTLAVDGVQDVSGNAANDSATFQLVTFPTAGLVAWWPLDEASGTTAPDEAGSAPGTLVNGPLWQPSGGRIGGALAFDGVDDRVTMGQVDVSGGDGLTIAFWTLVDDLDNSDARFVSKATNTSEQGHDWMVSTYDGNTVRLRLKAGGTTSTLVSSAGAISTGEWHHVAATYDGSTMRIFVDAAPAASASKTGAVANSSSVPLALGAQPQGSNELDGLLDDVRIYDRALSQAEIEVLASGSGPAESLLHVDDGTALETDSGTASLSFTVTLE